MLPQLAKLTEEQEMLRQALEGTIDRVSPVSRAQKLDNSKQFDNELHAALSELGILGVGVSEELGGGGGGAIEQVVILEALGRKATSMAVFMVVHFMITRLLKENGSEAQKRDYLTPLMKGEIKASFCLTEAGGGTDILAAMKTKAIREADGWIINGNKMWISGASTSDLMVVLARTSEHRSRGLSMFLVPTKARGITASEVSTMAINGYDTNAVAFDDVRIPEDALMGVLDDGFPQVIATLNGERMNAAAVAVGIGRGALEVTQEYALERAAFGRPIGQFQAVQHQLSIAGIAVETAWLATLEAARRDEAGEATDVLSSMAKWASARAAVQCTDTGMEIFAGAGFDTDLPIQRYYRDARLYSFAPLNQNMALNMIAERWFGFPRSF
ncbi:acyl-CoA dehydrogenase family protein [Chelatococcus asaccharovorans]|uniref:Alkylation response protein AidB-like acyl-CoA dehydrogenase n=1 Tax=Chelatococcus asaccharovorans TaxID=28210 RepID=A0A2V3TSQ5_9HYPH|nr:acyl-CoA dehydrogenase family protein [Chelatococcus asaccharovorans]MBS7707836.1 acyl-CoA dehydrogenase family protein [Chelatococcus asaccharovorans]PXW50917.1 alkylation response protein AidB-like acyl-CoA dehydrogenase [Chelatococcus asaccharovorans]